MKIGYGIIGKPVQLQVEVPPTEQNLDDYLNAIIDASYATWQAFGRKRTWNQADNSHAIIVEGNAYDQVTKRFKALAKERGLVGRIGRPKATEYLIIPVLVCDPPESQTRTVRAQSETFTITNTDWVDIISALQFHARHGANDTQATRLNGLADRLLAVFGRSLPDAVIRQLEA